MRLKSAVVSTGSILAVSLFVCEYLIYYIVQYQCQWPEQNFGDEVKLRALFVADPHLLGPFRGHWFDKLRREWQMHRAFITATTLHKPEATFFLGDVFDEGQWVDEAGFTSYLKRFKSLFPMHNSYIIVGNHDVGFHYVMKHKTLARFYSAFNLSSSDLVRVKGIPFVTINSMTMESDGCTFCKEAEQKLKNIAKNLGSDEKPYLLQHFPLFRPSDETCVGEDSAPDDEKTKPFRPKWDCLSQSASLWLLKLLKPRAVFSGHTHHGCVYQHDDQTVEYSLPSFSWRNRNNPSYFLVSFTSNDYTVEKCPMPRESTVKAIYLASISTVMCFLLWRLGLRCWTRNRYKLA